MQVKKVIVVLVFTLFFMISTVSAIDKSKISPGNLYLSDSIKGIHYGDIGPTNQQIADAVFKKINEIRAKYQKSNLVRNAQIDSVAQSFSDSMAQTLTYPSGPPHNAGGNNWSGADGRQKKILKMGFSYPAENIMKVSPSANKFGCDNVQTTVGNTADGIASYTVLSWVEHDKCAGDGHRKTLLSDPANFGGTSNYLPTDVGIGVAMGSDGNYYITADFAHKN